jgi:hypothetical protein
VNVPHEFLLCLNWILVSEACLLCNEKSAPSVAARARRAQCLVVWASGVRVCFNVVFVGVRFEVDIAEECGVFF